MLKRAIREQYLQKRLTLTRDKIQEYSARMIEQFSRLQLPEVNSLLSYYPLADRNEFNVAIAAELVKSRYAQVRIAWPRIETDMKTMEAYEVQADGLYAKNKFNILEPLNGQWLAPDKIDMVFVPLVAFDTRGYRVGYGKGFYDRYLARCRPNVVKTGFSFFDPLPIIEDINDFDVPLNFSITPSRIYEF